MIPFLNEHLKDGPPANIARVTAFEGGANEWRRLERLAASLRRGCPANLTPLYLAPGKRLGFTAPGGDAVRLLHLGPGAPGDLSRAPQPAALCAGSTWRQWLVDDQRFAEARPDVLTYATRAADRSRFASPARRSSTSSPRPAAATATGWSS